MPRLWSETIGEHKREVVEAILDSTRALVEKHGLRGVTMSQIAEEAGIGRATLYKYFGDVEAILVAWHERHVAGHLEALSQLRGADLKPFERLRQVLETYALIRQQHHDEDLAALLHKHHVEHAHDELHALVRDLVAACVKARVVRNDVPPAELATYCLHALAAASALPTKAALERLVEVTLAGLRA